LNTFYFILPIASLAYYAGYSSARRKGFGIGNAEPAPSGAESNSGEITLHEAELLDKYRRGTFKLRTYAHPDYRFVVGIPKRFRGGKRSRRFFRTADEAADFIEQAAIQIEESAGI